jgi:putative acyl-CoA dehydrogenase
MRMALVQALHHCRHRTVFGKRLSDHALMRAVLAELALEVEGAIALVMRLARAFDRAAEDSREAAYARLITPAAKYWICKRAPAFIYEAMECLGGNGYVEESVLPRLYREAPVNAIWEGSGNVMCLDVLRALRQEPEAAVARSLARELSAKLDDDSAGLAATDEGDARALTERIALVASAVALKASAPASMTEAFVSARLDPSPRGVLYGSARIDATAMELLLQRALPET